jgi:putative SOS response-associated peptidase YedK
MNGGMDVCGRFLLTYDIEAIKKYYHVSSDEHVIYAPSEEIFPSQKIPVIYSKSSENHLALMEWGFPKPQGKGILINARGETASLKPTFRRAFTHGRCLIPANGFFEWKQEGTKKIKHRIQLPDRGLFSMAGLFRQTGENSDLSNAVCIIITREPTSQLAQIHNRMPAILQQQDESMWLDEKQDTNALTLLITAGTHENVSFLIEPL